MTYNEFKLCKGCPVKGARYFDPDGYWCCKHPEAWTHCQTLEESGCERTKYTPDTPSGHESGDKIPFVVMKTCPAGHWKRTIEGGADPKRAYRTCDRRGYPGEPMISPSPSSPPTPCPYHRPDSPCGKEKNCPLYLFGEYVICTTPNQHQIVMVRACVEAL